MPREKKINDAEILALFEDLQNGKAVSRATGVHEQTIYQVIRRHKGVCLRCGGRCAPGKTSCETCLSFDRERVRVKRKERARLGVCEQCGAPRSAISKQYCDKHRLAHLERNDTYAAKQKLRGNRYQEVASAYQKRRSLKGLYGDAAVECLDDSNFKCEICGVAHKDIELHIHHIDEDRMNNTRDNFKAMCFLCHTTTHYLLKLRNRIALIAWFERTYLDKPLR